MKTKPTAAPKRPSARKRTPAKRRTAPSPVVVQVAGDGQQSQPENFRLCPLGLQFYSERKLEAFDVFELDLELPAARGKTRQVHCTGAVVHCQKAREDKRYRVWLHFLDLPAAQSKKIRCTAQQGGHLCSFCENF